MTAGKKPFSKETCEVLVLDEWHGFSFAVKAALDLVSTPYVLVVQHDHVFVRAWPLASILACMRADPLLLKVDAMSGATVRGLLLLLLMTLATG